MTDWNQEAKAILRAELARKNIGYKRLSQLLEQIGVEETPSAITNKMHRGSFSFAFYLQCMKAIGLSRVDIDLVKINVLERDGL
ncbi:DUF6471 domain-containing protein [Duganella fentianensis]|uniref:DUF6471 domain-containing protein n=1 Tax=Duganella fentianensis TaxID=2692177 RepID=UPI001E3C3DE8|nr:DUF6471 domain-containing protein [Duganella fentianensis]